MIWMLRLQRKHENNRNRSRTHITPIDERILQLWSLLKQSKRKIMLLFRCCSRCELEL